LCGTEDEDEDDEEEDDNIAGLELVFVNSSFFLMLCCLFRPFWTLDSEDGEVEGTKQSATDADEREGEEGASTVSLSPESSLDCKYQGECHSGVRAASTNSESESESE